MAIRWFVKPVDTQTAMEEGCEGEPFAYDEANDVVYTKVPMDIAADRSKASELRGGAGRVESL